MVRDGVYGNGYVLEEGRRGWRMGLYSDEREDVAVYKREMFWDYGHGLRTCQHCWSPKSLQ